MVVKNGKLPNFSQNVQFQMSYFLFMCSIICTVMTVYIFDHLKTELSIGNHIFRSTRVHLLNSLRFTLVLLLDLVVF